MNAGEIAAATRRAAALFEMDDRGLLEVAGSDRVRWLDGMISGDVEALEKRGEGAGCYATLLTNRGRIVADLHVGRLDDVFLLESKRSELPRIRETLDRFIIADDVLVRDRSDPDRALGLEGPRAGEILSSALGGDGAVPAREQWARVEIAGVEVILSGFGFSGERAVQIRVPKDRQDEVVAALELAAGRGGLLRGNPDALEILRVEAGVPSLGRELDEDVLPPEARLERAIAIDKGCYVGQEIVARLRSRGQVNHLLVGLRLDGAGPMPNAGAELSVDGRKTGEITSVARSPAVGAIALAFVRREHAEPDTLVEIGREQADGSAAPASARGDEQDSAAGFPGSTARVSTLPFVPLPDWPEAASSTDPARPA